MSEFSWFAAKCVFRHEKPVSGLYEERIVLFRATDFEDAIQQAENEANQYCDDVGDCSFTGFVDVFWLFETEVGHGTEVYSSMRYADLDQEEYLDRFYDTESEDCEREGRRHHFYNKGNGKSGCHRCRTVLDGKLWK